MSQWAVGNKQKKTLDIFYKFFKIINFSVLIGG